MSISLPIFINNNIIVAIVKLFASKT